MHPIIAVLFIAVLTAAADFLLKTGSSLPNPFTSMPTLIGVAIYALTGFGWVHVMQRANLTVIATIYSAITIILLVAMSLFVFREAVSVRQLAGAGLALVAVLLSMS